MPGLFDCLGDDHHHEKREGYLRSPLNYPGNKFSSLPNLLPLIPYDDSFVDVFGGTGQVLMARKSSPLEVFNDRHAGIAAFFLCIQDAKLLEQLIERIRLLPHSREIFSYFKQTINEESDTLTRAVKWYYLVQSSFVGRAEYFGRITKRSTPIFRKLYDNLELFADIHERFTKVQVENLSWDMILKDYDSYKTVFYMDPPYINSNIYEHGMSPKDHHRMCSAIMNVKGFVALSGYDNDIYDQYEWDHKYEWGLQNNVTTMAFSEGSVMEGREDQASRTKVRKECLWIKETR